MQNATALFCVDVTTPDAKIQSAAEAAVGQNAHLAVLLHAEFPTLPLNAFGAMPYGGVAAPAHWSETLEGAQADLQHRTEAIEQLIASTGASADVRPLFVSAADIRPGVARSALVSDIALFAPDLREMDMEFKEMLYGVLFDAPVPVLVNGGLDFAHDRVLVAWNDGLASSRAVHLALPYLQKASEVTLACFDAPSSEFGGRIEPGAPAASWLSHHGCNVTLAQVPSGGREVGQAILDHAAALGSDLIVSGAYGHSRLREAVFGGTSRTLIEQLEMPVLMAH